MFVRPRDAEREMWDGPRAGVEGAKEQLRRGRAFTIDKLADELPELLQNTSGSTIASAANRAFDDKVLDAIDARARAREARLSRWPRRSSTPARSSTRCACSRSRRDLDAMRRAARRSRARRTSRAMGSRSPGMHEYEVEAMLLETFRTHGAERPAYGSIVGSGPTRPCCTTAEQPAAWRTASCC